MKLSRLLAVFGFSFAWAQAFGQSATGGTITTGGGYTIHTFTESGTFTVTSGTIHAEVLIVGGGGGGGGGYGGGGGGGGVVYNSALALGTGGHAVTIGDAGTPGRLYSSRGGNGGNSSIDAVAAVGGGGGGTAYTTEDGLSGGSGGGAVGYGNPGAATIGQGYHGGYGWPDGSSAYGSGGGGGAGGAGNDGTSTHGGNGGPGAYYSLSGSSVAYGGGGGGGVWNGEGVTGTSGSGGVGGGADASLGGGHWADPGTGGGGGGGAMDDDSTSADDCEGGPGGSGIVIIRYQNFPAVTSATTASGVEGTSFSYTITATNSPTGYSHTGTLPTGLSRTGAVISGTPTQTGSFPISIFASNTFGTSAAVTLTITISPPAPVITSATSAAGIYTSSFSYSITGTNSPTSYSLTGTLPTGLSYSTSTGVISGTPTQVGSFPVTIGATNVTGTGTTSLTIAIGVAPPSPPTPGSTVADTSFTLSWTSVTGAVLYEVRRDSTSLGTTSGTSMGLTALTASTGYSMTVRAKDSAGAWSAWSSAVTVTTLALNPATDSDSDGVTDVIELELGTDPNSSTPADSTDQTELKVHRSHS